jgi:hypothetical protein
MSLPAHRVGIQDTHRLVIEGVPNCAPIAYHLIDTMPRKTDGTAVPGTAVEIETVFHPRDVITIVPIQFIGPPLW